MGLIRKAASVSTLGAVKYTSRREAQTKAALQEAKLLRDERKAAKREQQAAQRAEFDAAMQRMRDRRAARREQREAQRDAS